MANMPSRMATSEPARAPQSNPSQSDPVTEVAIAAQNAPSSNCPSIAMLITPEVEQITPVSAPSMIGIESLRVPDSRFTTLNEIDCPASDQAISEITKVNSTRPIATRRPVFPSASRPSRDSSRTKARTRLTAPQTKQVTAAGSGRLGTETLANSGVKANVAVPCACSPNTRMSIRPKTAKVTGAAYRPAQVTAGPASDSGGSRDGSRAAEVEVTRSTPWT